MYNSSLEGQKEYQGVAGIIVEPYILEALWSRLEVDQLLRSGRKLPGPAK